MSVERWMSDRFSIRDTCSCFTPRVFAKSTWVICRALRNSRMVIPSAISKCVRRAIFLRRVAGRVLSFSCKVFMTFSLPCLSCLQPSVLRRAVHISHRLSLSAAYKTSSRCRPSCRRRRVKQPGASDQKQTQHATRHRLPQTAAPSCSRSRSLSAYRHAVGRFRVRITQQTPLRHRARPEHLPATHRIPAQTLHERLPSTSLVCSLAHMTSSALCVCLNYYRQT